MEQSYADLLDDLLDVESGMSDWEVSFVDSVDQRRQQVGPAMPLTDKQRAKIDELWMEHCR